MIDQRNIEDLEEAQEKLLESDIKNEFVPEIMGALVKSEPGIRKLSTASNIKVTQKKEPVKIELEESVLETEEGKEAIKHIYENSEATKKALTSVLILTENNDKVTLKEIQEFSGYSDATEVSRACSVLEDRAILDIDSSGDVNLISLTEEWLENLIKLPELKQKQRDIIEFM